MKYLRLGFYLVVIAVLLVSVIGIYYYADSPQQDDLGTFVNVGLIGAYVLVVGSIIIALGFAVANLTHNKRAAIRVLGGVAGIVVILGISYAASSGEILPSYESVGFTSPSLSKLVSASLVTMYIIFAATFVVTIYSEVSRLFK